MKMFLFIGLLVALGYRKKLQRTPHGWHLYTNIIMSKTKLCQLLRYLEADPAWIAIGRERGYFFLADKKPLHFNWKVEHMVIHHGKEKTQNT